MLDVREKKSQKFLNYVRWMQERGQLWIDVQPHGNSSIAPVSQQSMTTTMEKYSQSGEEFDRTDGFREADSASQRCDQKQLIRILGNKGAKVVGIVDCILGQPPIFGVERALLLKILSAISVDPRHHFGLLGLETTTMCQPIGTPFQYQKEIIRILTAFNPRAVICFGTLAYKIGFPQLCSRKKIGYQLLSLKDIGISCDLLIVDHLQSLHQNPKLKEQAWLSLQSLMKKTKFH